MKILRLVCSNKERKYVEKNWLALTNVVALFTRPKENIFDQWSILTFISWSRSDRQNIFQNRLSSGRLYSSQFTLKWTQTTRFLGQRFWPPLLAHDIEESWSKPWDSNLHFDHVPIHDHPKDKTFMVIVGSTWFELVANSTGVLAGPLPDYRSNWVLLGVCHPDSPSTEPKMTLLGSQDNFFLVAFLPLPFKLKYVCFFGCNSTQIQAEIDRKNKCEM